MQYSVDELGSRSDLPIKIIDVGIGLERIPWLLNRTPTSYTSTFSKSAEFLRKKLAITLNEDLLRALSPWSSMLNNDDFENIDQSWEMIAKKLNVSAKELKTTFKPIKDFFLLLDHTRTLFVILSDGLLPSSIGGGGNLRNLIRRTFIIMEHNGWDKIIKTDELLELCSKHGEDLEPIIGRLPANKNIRVILEKEYLRWSTTEVDQKHKLDKLLKKKSGQLDKKDWVTLVTSLGIPAETVSEISGLPIPQDLKKIIQEREATTGTTIAGGKFSYKDFGKGVAPTEILYATNEKLLNFEDKIVDSFWDSQNNQLAVILSKTYFYPTSGGQLHDEGTMEFEINGQKLSFNVVNCIQEGKHIIHVLKPVDVQESFITKELLSKLIGARVECKIDGARRKILKQHHSATHIVFAAARRVLGPHVWQDGAKKNTDYAHLDITHYEGLTREVEQRIESECFKIVEEDHPIEKFFLKKGEAEGKYGFTLYQGGIVPDSTLRIVQIPDVDTEACCGIHCDSTHEVGQIRILKTAKVSDGIVRIYFVAGRRAYETTAKDRELITKLCDLWSVQQEHIFDTATRFFKEFKKSKTHIANLDKQFIATAFQACLEQVRGSHNQSLLIQTPSDNSGFYFTFMKSNISKLSEFNTDLIVQGSGFIVGSCNRGQFSAKEVKDHKAIKPSLTSW